jgi:hypothetical protein
MTYLTRSAVLFADESGTSVDSMSTLEVAILEYFWNGQR